MAACLAKREVIFVDPVHIFLFHASDSCLYWVTRQDVAQETEEGAELAALASAAHYAQFSVSRVTYILSIHPVRSANFNLISLLSYEEICSPL